MPSKPAVSKAKKIFWAGLTAVAGALLIILARDCAELYQNYYYTDDQLWFIAVAGLILVSLPFFVIKKRSRPSTKWWIVTILSLLFILNTLMVMVWWDGSPFSDYTVYDVDGEYVESGINKYVIGGYGVQCWLSTFLLFGIVVLIFSATGSGVNTLTHRYIAVANRYVDALDSGKNYEIEAAEKALRTYFRSQKSRLSNSKFKYQYLKYLDEQGIPFADSVDSLKESLNYAAIARSMA